MPSILVLLLGLPTSSGLPRMPKFTAPWRKDTTSAKLASIPLFTVSNANGSPFMLAGEEGEGSSVVFFFSAADAEGLLDEMSQLGTVRHRTELADSNLPSPFPHAPPPTRQTAASGRAGGGYAAG